MFVRPLNALLVPDPAHRGAPPSIYFLPVEGRDVGDDNTGYWVRRVSDGDVATDAPPPAPPAPGP